MSETKRVVLSTPVPGLLTVTFIVLKLTHVIAWSWLWVLAPSWLPFVLFLLFLFVFTFAWAAVSVLRGNA